MDNRSIYRRSAIHLLTSIIRKFFIDKVSRVAVMLVLMLYIVPESLSTAYSEKKRNGYIIINLGDKNDSKYVKGWFDALSRKDIIKWGKSHRVQLIDDSPPVVNNRARFVSKIGSVISISGLKYYGKYRMWIDFVHVRNIEDIQIPARLEIFIDGHQVKAFNFADITAEDNPCRIEIPYEFTVDGKVDILFRERSSSGGFFGVWDIIVSDKMKYPEKIGVNRKKRKKMEAQNRIIENKSKNIGRKRRK